MQHKTSGLFGSANLVVPKMIHEMVSRYAEKHRPSPAADFEGYVFLTPQGRQVAHIADELRALTKHYPTALGVVSMTTTQMRKLTATEVARDESDEAVRTVATHMTHGHDTAKKYYQHLEGVQAERCGV